MVMDRKVESLIQKAQNGDEDSFQTLYKMYYQKAYYLAMKITYNEADAKDVVQETFIQIHRSLPDLRDLCLFQPWMNRIVISKCNRLFTKNKETILDPEIIRKSDKAVETSVYRNPHKRMTKKVQQDILLQLLKDMKPKHREVLVLMYLCEMKQQEIAEVLQINLNTVKSRTMYAKQELKQLVEIYEEENDYKFEFRMETIGTLLTTAFIMEAKAFASNTIISSSLPSIFAKVSSFIGSHSVVATTCLVLTSSVVVTGVAQGIQAVNNSNESLSEQVNHYEKENFKAVNYQGTMYDNSKDAYFALVNWANTKTMIENKTETEKQEARKLFYALQDVNNEYYQMLIAQNIDKYLK